MKKITTLVLALALLLTACGSTQTPAAPDRSESAGTPEVQQPAAASGKTLSFGTSSLGGNFFTMGAAMASVIMDNVGVSVTAQATSGSSYNVGAVEDGELDLGMCQASAVAMGVKGVDSYEGNPTDNVRTLLNYNATPVHILVNKSVGASDFSGLKGTKVECMTPGDGIEMTAMKFMPLLGISLDDISMEYSGNRVQSSSRLKTGQVDVILDATGIGATWIADIYGDGSNFQLLSLSEEEIATICNDSPEYTRMIIPAGTYSGQDEDVVTVGLWTTIICNSSLDDDTAYGIVKSVMEHKEDLVKAHSFFGDLAPENIVDACQAPLHPGAEKYYKEVNVLS